MLAFLQCTNTCRVAVSRLDGGGRKVVAGSSRASDPTVSGSRVAWVRGNATVMTSTRKGSGRRTLPGAPRRKCYDVLRGGRKCARPRDRRIIALELDGSQLTLVAEYGLPDDASAGGAVAEIRTESVKAGPQELVALMTTGEALQTYIGPSWVKGKLYFYKSCLGDSSGCSSDGGTYRFDAKRNRYALARDDTVLAGFAIDADGRHATTATADCDDDEQCEVGRTGALSFKRVGSQLREP